MADRVFQALASIRNARHQLFIKAYIMSPLRGVKFNATRSYMQVYPQASYKTALVNGPRLTHKYQFVIGDIMDAQMREELSARPHL